METTKLLPTRPQDQTSTSFWTTVQGYWQLTRLHKWPLGNILVFWPCVWALNMAGYSLGIKPQDLLIQVLLFAIGSTLLHSAACVLNDICDRDFDALVERTKNRPLVTGKIPLYGAWILLLALLIPTLFMLSLVNPTAQFYGIFGIFPFHALYPLMKRWTYWPQAWLGLAMNWGFPTAWLYLRPDATQLLPVYAMMPGLVCWTIVYDTIYSCQDRKDDAQAGVKSTGLLFGTWVREILALFSVGFIASLVVSGVLNHQGLAYYIITCGGATLHLVWQLTTWNVDDPRDCGAKFKANGDVLGAIVWAGILADCVWKL